MNGAYPEIQTSALRRKAQHFRRVALWLGLLFFALTFIFTGGNHFNVVNVVCWLASILLVLFAFWQFPQSPRASWEYFVSGLRKRDWKLNISRWTLILLVAFAVIAFFRFSDLGSAPAEMTSEHAETILDLGDISNGQYAIFFERNGGREPVEFYVDAFVAGLLGTGASFLTLKLGSSLLALGFLLYVYLLGKELGGRWVGLFALLLVGVGYWPNLLARLGLAFSLYPLFAAPTLYYLLRGLRSGSLNDLLLGGLFMGLGLNGYAPFRVMLLVAAVAVLFFVWHTSDKDLRRRGLIGAAVLALVTLVVCGPLLRYTIGNPELVFHWGVTRILQGERAYPGSVPVIFAGNFWNAIKMFNVSGGTTWTVGLTQKPAFDLISAALLLIGALLVGIRYARSCSWQDLFLLLAVPLMLLPTILSLAFPEENPAMDRDAGAWVPAFLLAAFGLEAFLHGLREKLNGRIGRVTAIVAGCLLLVAIATANAGLFGEYLGTYDQSAWNTSELGAVISDYAGSFGTYDSAWVVSYPYWVDTRLVAVTAGNPGAIMASGPIN